MIATPRQTAIYSLVIVVLAATLSFALQPPKPNCAERVQIRLFFGLSTPDGVLSDDEWGRFLADVVTPRFPRGLTVVRADGQWRDSDHADVTREPSRVVEIVHDDQRDLDRRIEEVVAIYRRLYRQESVMLTRQRIEVCF